MKDKEEKEAFLVIDKEAAKDYFITPLPKVGMRVRLVFVGHDKQGDLQFQLETVNEL